MSVAGEMEMRVSADKCVQMVTRAPRSKYYRLVCIGPKRHYRKNGECGHLDWLLAMVKPEIAHRVKVTPFGGSGLHPEPGPRHE